MSYFSYDLGVIGAGNMAEAIVRGVCGAKLIAPDRVIAADVSDARRELFSKSLETAVTADNLEASRQSKILLLSVKPQQAPAVLNGIGGVLSPDTLVISIMAGVSSMAIKRHLGNDKPWRVIRTMPNTPMLVGEGMVAISCGSHATVDDLKQARQLFESCASVVEVKESDIDAVTALSGSGPAYFFFLVEQMIDAGVKMGLTSEQSRALAHKTAAGAGKMLGQSADSAQELRRKVTSPGGTTQAAIESMQQSGVDRWIVEAILAAQKRSKELGS